MFLILTKWQFVAVGWILCQLMNPRLSWLLHHLHRFRISTSSSQVGVRVLTVTETLARVSVLATFVILKSSNNQLILYLLTQSCHFCLKDLFRMTNLTWILISSETLNLPSRLMSVQKVHCAVSKYDYIIMYPKAIWAICCTHQHCHCQSLLYFCRRRFWCLSYSSSFTLVFVVHFY